MKHLVISILLFSAAAGFAVEVPANRRLTPEQQRERAAKMTMKRYGGLLRKANSAHGKVLFLNAQGKVGRSDLQRALNVIEDRVRPIWTYKEAELAGQADYAQIVKSNGCELGVVLVAAKGQPALLVAPESGWAVVNVAALDDGCDKEKLARRTRIELLRAFGYVAGGTFLVRDSIVMQGDIITPKDLDRIPQEDYGIDAISAFERNLPLRGVTPWFETTYKKACQEGWAPAPTNEFQKAIWDKVHALPTNPIKIKPETKPVKE